MSEPNDDNAQADQPPTAGDPDPFAGPSWSGDRPFAGASQGEHRDGAVRVRRRRKRLAGIPVGRKRRGRPEPASNARSPRRKLAMLGSGALGLLVLLSLGWLVFSSLEARSQLESVRTGVAKMRLEIADGKLAKARATAKSIKGHADDASFYTSGPVWAIGSSVPYLGDPMDTARALTGSVKLVADHALPPLIDASDDLRPSNLRRPDGGFNLKPVQALGPVMLKAGTTMKAALADAKHASGSTWLGPVNHARTQLVDQLTPLTGTVDNIGRASRVLPPLLGVDGPKRYMIAFENDAELRGLGGIPGSFAIVTIDDGKIEKPINFRPDTYLEQPGISVSPFLLGDTFNRLNDTATQDFLDSDTSPHFPYSARIWAKMWQLKTGQTLDGAMALDPTALSYLLKASGPVGLKHDPTTQVTSSNVVALTQQTLYARFRTGANNPRRKAYLQDIASSVSKKLLGPGIDTTALVKQGGLGAAQHRLVFWAKDPKIERQIAALPLGGTVPKTTHPYVGVALSDRSGSTNHAGSKLDYYLHASLDWQRTSCSDVTITLKLTNAAPPGLPPYVSPAGPAETNTLIVAMYGSAGGQFAASVGGYSLDTPSGTATTLPRVVDQGHPVIELQTVSVARGATTTLVFHEVDKQPLHGAVIVRRQPMINHMTVTRHNGC